MAHAAGAPTTFLICCIVAIVWAASGPFFGFSDTWQLVINTGTTIVTFLMVFLIQNTQNCDGAAIQAKLDELIRASASQNAFMGIEHLTQAEVEEFRVKCAERAAAAAAGDQAVCRRTKRRNLRRISPYLNSFVRAVPVAGPGDSCRFQKETPA